MRPRSGESDLASGHHLEGRAAVFRGDSIDVGDAHPRDLRALDLDYVLGVAFAAVREVEAARVHVVVRDQDLGVHEVMHRSLRVWRRTLGSEARTRGDAVECRDLPGRTGLT